VQNWLNEFNVWLPSKKPEIAKQDKKAKNSSPVPKANPPSPQSLMNESISDTVSLNLSFDSTLNLLTEEDDRIEESAPPLPPDTGEVHLRGFEVFVLNETVKTLQAREKIISNWSTKGGVMLIGYEMYRMLALRKLKRAKKQSTFYSDESQSEAAILDNIHSFLVNPGPDLVICDEGHRIKNSGASISQALKSIRTKRRVVLTGYPLQNNLMEYWCMVDFIRPNYLGSKVEFSNMFERPISNGQCVDSTPEDRRLMRFRSHVLHSLLEGFVQRRSHAVLHNVLPEKQEWVFLLKMTPVQYRLYKEFMQYLSDNNEGQNGANPIKAFAVCCKIWNHPDALYNVVRKKQSILDDLDLDEVNGSNSNDTKARNGRGKKTEKDNRIGFFDGGGFNFPKNHFGNIGTYNKSGTEALSLDWALPVFENYEPGVLENGVKFEILFEIIKETVAVKDKLLIFSQTLLSLDLIESFFHKKFNWIKNAEYYRLDGSTTGLERERLINNFNSKKDVFVFLVSTRAGSLGINLTGANRVVVLDASWNPCHDCQAVCRIYR
jgi:RAD54-like protein 2